MNSPSNQEHCAWRERPVKATNSNGIAHVSSVFPSNVAVNLWDLQQIEREVNIRLRFLVFAKDFEIGVKKNSYN